MKQPGWQKRLLSLINSKQGSAFEWGGNDCLRLAFEAVETITNTPFVPWPYPKYSTPKEALMLSSKYSPVAILQAIYDFEDVKPQFQQVGDIGFAYQEGLWRGPVFLGRYAASIAPGYSLTFFPSEKTAAVKGLKIMRLL